MCATLTAFLTSILNSTLPPTLPFFPPPPHKTHINPSSRGTVLGLYPMCSCLPTCPADHSMIFVSCPFHSHVGLMPADADFGQLIACFCPIKKLPCQKDNKSAPLMGPIKKLPHHYKAVCIAGSSPYCSIPQQGLYLSSFNDAPHGLPFLASTSWSARADVKSSTDRMPSSTENHSFGPGKYRGHAQSVPFGDNAPLWW